MGLDQTGLVNINELEGFDNGFHVFENLCRESDLGEAKRPGVKNPNGHKKCERFKILLVK